MIKPNILITGSNRSGTTWVAKMLTASRHVNLINEPFNLANIRKKGIACPLQHHFQYMTDKDSVAVKRYIEGLLRAFAPDCRNDFMPRKMARQIVDVSRRMFMTKAHASVASRRTVFKDPTALFSASWFEENLGCRVLVLIRHPAAYVSSLKRMGWRTDFSDMLKQHELVHRYLLELKAEIKSFKATPDNLVEEAILRWKIYHSVIRQYKEEFPDWEFVRHEDLCRNPVDQFRRLYDILDLDFSDEVRQGIIDSTESKNEPALGNKTHVLVRNSRNLVKRWKTLLSREEIDVIYKQTHVLSSEFYSDKDW